VRLELLSLGIGAGPDVGGLRACRETVEIPVLRPFSSSLVPSSSSYHAIAASGFPLFSSRSVSPTRRTSGVPAGRSFTRRSSLPEMRSAKMENPDTFLDG